MMSGGFTTGADSGSQQGFRPRGPQSLRQLTMKQMNHIKEATGQTATISGVVNGVFSEVELGIVSVIGSIRQLKETDSGIEYVAEDGTGTLSMFGYNNGKFNFVPFEIGTWIRAWGTWKTMGDRRSFNLSCIRPMEDFNDITLHFLQAIQQSCPKKLDNSTSSNEVKNDEMSNFTPIQKSVFAIFKQCNLDQGVHKGSVVRSLSAQFSPHEIEDTIDSLVKEGLIFNTFDSDHFNCI